jgi:hypothetical protein
MKLRLIFAAILILFSWIFSLRAQECLPLWPKSKMPDSKGLKLKDSISNEWIYRVAVPGMYAFFPSKDDNSETDFLSFAKK